MKYVNVYDYLEKPELYRERFLCEIALKVKGRPKKKYGLAQFDTYDVQKSIDELIEAKIINSASDIVVHGVVYELKDGG